MHAMMSRSALMSMAAVAIGAQRKPHIVFTLVDDWGSADAAFREAELRPGATPQLVTPHIDSLAAAGVVLDKYYVQHICSPTRTALLSGRYQIHTGLQDGIIQAWARVCLPPKFGTIADALGSLGYITHMVGKVRHGERERILGTNLRLTPSLPSPLSLPLPCLAHWQWHAGIFQDACLPWHRGFGTYYGFLTGSEHHYTKVQRIARGYRNGTKDFPDLRTHRGPVATHCIADPLAPPPPHRPCGGAPLPRCNYTVRQGYLAAGHDAVPPRLLPIAHAEAACDALPNCSAITFATPASADCQAQPCKMYLKTAGAGTSAGGEGWQTLFKYPVPPSAQGDPSCYSTHMFTRAAVSIIDAHDASRHGAPLFLYLALQDVHEPVEVPPAYSQPFETSILDGTRRAYAGMVSVVDECVRNVTEALKANGGMWADTIFVLSNDNGGWAGYGGLNAPYRGHKTQLWEGGIRGLGIVVAPGRLPAHARYAGLMHVTDWLATFVSAAGGDLPDLGARFAGVDGVSQWRALAMLSRPTADGQEPSAVAPSTLAPSAGAFPRTEILHNIEGLHGQGIAVLRVGAHKLLHNMQDASFWCDACNSTGGCWMPPNSGPGAGAAGHTVALGGQLCCYSAPPSKANHTASCPAAVKPPRPLPLNLLYDIDADPSELVDLSSSHPEVVQAMLARLAAYNATNVPCCICTGSDRTSEMDHPPLDGFWTSFRDQSPNPDPNCKLQSERSHWAA